MMDFQKHFEKGWKNTMQFIGPAILLTIVQGVLSVISFGILAPVMFAGYTKSFLLAQREGRVPEMKDLFSEMSLFFPLLLLAIVMMIAVSLGFMLLVIPGLVLAILINFAGLYIVPLMADKDMGIMDAVKESWSISMRNPITDQIIIAVVYAGILGVGGSFMITWLFAFPLATFILLSVYDERIKAEEARAIEE